MAILSGVSDVKPEAKESPNKQDTQAALLLRNAFTYRMASNKTVMVIANGNVTLTPIGDIDVALQFTPEQWARIVAFVEEQTEPQGSWRPDWSKIPATHNYAAIDGDGRAFAYPIQPRILDDSWYSRGEYFCLDEYDDIPAFTDWKNSLVQRPGV